MAFVELTPAQVAALEAVAQQYASGVYLTREQVISLMNSEGASFRGEPAWRQYVINAGTVTPTLRSGVISYAEIDTEASAATDDLTDIAGSFADGDLLFIRPQYNSRSITVLSSGNISINGGAWTPANTTEFMLLQYNGSTWREACRWPAYTRGGNTRETAYIQPYDGIVFYAFVNTNILDLINLGAETLAEGEITITATGGTITVLINAGDAPIALGEFTTSGTVSDAATGAAAAINALTTVHGYTASSALGVLTVIAPTGTGATANTYTLALVLTGTMAATVTTAMGGGVDGVETAVTLDYLLTGSDGDELILRNAMAAATITITAGYGTNGFNFTLALLAGENLRIINNAGIWERFV